VSSGTSTRSVVMPVYDVSADGKSFDGPWPYANNDLVAIGVTSGGVWGTASLPLGLLVQPHERLSLSLGGAYRAIFTNGSKNYVGSYLSASAEVVITPFKQMDIGFRFELPGPVNASWADTRLMSAWIGAHI